MVQHLRWPGSAAPTRKLPYRLSSPTRWLVSGQKNPSHCGQRYTTLLLVVKVALLKNSMLHLEILDQKRQTLLPLVATAGQGFYLAGGTALALQLGHRDSIDFDFFVSEDIDTTELWGRIERVFLGHELQKTQDEKNTLSVTIDGEVRLSFFGYHYPLLETPLEENGLALASIHDIGCMKLSAITSRSTLKDYVDLYFILQHISLSALLSGCAQKYPTLDHTLILKSLVYFDDITAEPIRFMPGFTVTSEEIESSLTTIVKDFLS